MRLFRRIKHGICPLCGNIAKPAMIYGKHYYNTASCCCPEAIAVIVEWLETMDAAWKPPPKTETELLTDAINRVAEALTNCSDVL